MARCFKILRRSIHSFINNFNYTTTSLLLAFPFSSALLFSQFFLPSSPLFLTIHNHLNSLFEAAGFPPSSQLFTILNHYISQTITSSILVLPFTLSFLLISKASMIHDFLHDHQQQKPSFASFLSIYNSILSTQICNSLLILSANASCFALFFVAFSCLEASGYSSASALLFLSTTGAILYSIILGNSFIVCNLALVTSGMDKSGGFSAILKACVLIRGRTATALALAIPVNMALVAVEALFHYRVVTAFNTTSSSTAFEGIFVAWVYTIIVVIDTIVNYKFFKSCKRGFRIDEEGGYAYLLRIEGQNGKTVEELPLSSKDADNFI
ncbi:hypothetical protein RHMOL_Rhmol08G0205600 [Rhododendron molle]|uniref:Uncharacterized protein n=1 Tax=Rhododendron molle TaxID=49168 RepID=A0ACC0MQH9_RHOML|nr:hypothetical protein RHMOL_Rhmol08G0205600 [Rhododendron molle]